MTLTPRDWGLLADMLEAQWRGNDYEAFPYHHGLFEGRSECADAIRSAAPEDQLGALYRFLASTLKSGYGGRGDLDA